MFEEDGSKYNSEVIMNNDPCIIFTIEGDCLLINIRRVSYNACSPPNKYLKKPRNLLTLVCDIRFGSATSPATPNVLSGAPTCSQKSLQSLPWYSYVSHQRSPLLLYHSSEIPVTVKACRNALHRSDTVLLLMHLSLHCTFSQTVLEACRD
jgi:hypothetical protein